MSISQKTKEELKEFKLKLERMNSSTNTCDELYELIQDVIWYAKNNEELQSVPDSLDKQLKDTIIPIKPNKSRNLYNDKSKKLFDKTQSDCLWFFKW